MTAQTIGFGILAVSVVGLAAHLAGLPYLDWAQVVAAGLGMLLPVALDRRVRR